MQEEYKKKIWAALPPIIKNFYDEDPAVANMSKRYVADLRKNNNNIEVAHVFKTEGNSEDEELKIPNPIETFKQAFKVI